MVMLQRALADEAWDRFQCWATVHFFCSGVMATALDQFVKMGIVLLTSAPFIGLMAWTVPNALCIDAMKEASGGEDVLDGFKECIFMHNADWDNSPILTTVVSKENVLHTPARIMAAPLCSVSHQSARIWTSDMCDV